MHKKKNIILSLLFILFPILAKGQISNVDWILHLADSEGYGNVYLIDIEVDSIGNTYAAINYTSNLTIPILNKKMPQAPHVHALIIKIDKKGNPLWVHAFKSDYANGINDISLTSNGDLLITGFGDGLLCFPSIKNDTLKVGKEKEVHYQRFQGFYAARYSSDGERKWVQYFDCSWGQGISIAANKKDEIYMTFYHRGNIFQNEILIDSFENTRNYSYKNSIAKFDGNGNLQNIKNLGYTNELYFHKIKLDYQNNILLYGSFYKTIKLSEHDSLSQLDYYDSNDSFLAKYDDTENLLWVKRIGGENSQRISDIVVAPDNSIYVIGDYYTECVISDKINLIQKSEVQQKTSRGFFYFRLFEDGELDFARFEQHKKGSHLVLTSNSIALDPNEEIHIVGTFSDTLQIDGYSITTPSFRHIRHFYSSWNNQELMHLKKIEELGGGSPKTSINKEAFAVGSGYFAYNDAYLMVNGQKIELKRNKKQGNATSTCIWGGIIPEDKMPKENLCKDSIKNKRIKEIEPLLICSTPEENPEADVWFLTTDTIFSLESTFLQHPCGEIIEGVKASLYPNPTKSELNVELVGMIGKVHLNIYTSNGSLILSQCLEDNTDNQIINFDVSRLVPGIYFVKIRHKNYEKAMRFIKI